MKNKDFVNKAGIDIKLFHVTKEYRTVGTGVKENSRRVVRFYKTRETPVGFKTFFPDLIVINNG